MISRKPIRIVIAPNAFKECISSCTAAEVIKKGVLQGAPNARIITLPLADGGDGMLEAFLSTRKCKIIRLSAKGPLLTQTRTQYAILEDGTAVIELALISGLHLIPLKKRNASAASTFGLGQVIKHAISKGCKKFIIGIGGSATTDGGTGMARALGFKFLDSTGRQLPHGGSALKKLSRVVRPPIPSMLQGCNFRIACDVDNPLLGKDGAAAVYGPQKGAGKTELRDLESGLEQLAEVVESLIGQKYRNFPGSGAAGGTGFLFKSLLKAELVSGAELILSNSGFENKCRGADLIITAEGCVDGQSENGKLISRIAEIGTRLSIPVVVLAGRLGPGWQKLEKKGITCGFSIAPGPVTLPESIKNAEGYLNSLSYNVIRLFLSRKVHKC